MMESAISKPDSKAQLKPDTKDDLKSLPLPEVEKKLGSSADGLSQAEAEKRLGECGPNEIEEKKSNALLKFLSYCWGPIPWMIEVAVILSGVVRHWPDFFIILLLLLANAAVGFFEEREAGNAIEALKANLAIKARVKRDGKWVTPPVLELVPGDVIRLRLGDIVQADARLLAGDEVEVDQSALTGDSLPAIRKSAEAVFSASIIRRGEIGALVSATGANTYIGKTAQRMRMNCICTTTAGDTGSMSRLSRSIHNVTHSIGNQGNRNAFCKKAMNHDVGGCTLPNRSHVRGNLS